MIDTMRELTGEESQIASGGGVPSAASNPFGTPGMYNGSTGNPTYNYTLYVTGPTSVEGGGGSATHYAPLLGL
jgi:hypothetical protein